MKSSVYKSCDELPLFLNSDTVAKALGVAPSSAYELMHEITQAYYDRQFEKAELAAAQQKAKAKAEKLGIQFVPAGDGQSA